MSIIRNLINAAFCGLALTATAAKAETLTVALGTDPAFISVYVAEQRGLFEKAGLDVKLLRMAQGGDAMDAVVAGQATFGIAADQTVMIRLARADIKPLAVVSESGTHLELISRPDIGDPSQIKKLGVIKGTVSEYAAVMLLKKYQLDPSAVTLVPAGAPDLPALLQRGDVDAFFGWPPFNEQGRQQGGKTLLTSGDVGYVYTMWLSAQGEWLKTHQEEAKKFLAVVAEVNRDITTDRNAAAIDFQKATRMRAADTVPLIERLSFQTRDFSEADLVSFAGIADFLYEQKRTPQRVNIENYVQKGFFKE
ncbi:ABC transporter substrate-binding protein [Ochrobactrum teleogrylli]|uniref:SsuA/THI5-like domain-containing protein n=1 Tax=Ochrobactrum teleogrylli TaxID=2479765 RepID=A0ABY2Y1T2_9HYPH|nr:NrtA/SsuA/CpmA family ABC transporter substrate-binding protein [[Ochrobactrum] teleogrylli]TNV12404.1 hypothetical protein FIC94_17680 [[Ochrobactrum] teleogrylli]